MASIIWGREIAEVYDEVNAGTFAPAALDPMVDVLVELARGGPVLEFAVGTGRLALRLAERGIRVQGIELSPYMSSGCGRSPVPMLFRWRSAT